MQKQTPLLLSSLRLDLSSTYLSLVTVLLLAWVRTVLQTRTLATPLTLSDADWIRIVEILLLENPTDGWFYVSSFYAQALTSSLLVSLLHVIAFQAGEWSFLAFERYTSDIAPTPSFQIKFRPNTLYL